MSDLVSCLLQDKLEIANERIAMLEQALGSSLPAPVCLGLSPTEGRLFGMLRKREFVTKAAITACLYSGRLYAPDPKGIDVVLSKLRKKLQARGIKILTKWGEGYYMTPATKQQIEAIE